MKAQVNVQTKDVNLGHTITVVISYVLTNASEAEFMQ
jgi:hypothetical protein